MNDDFYRAFEERFRGTRDLITSRLHIYLPFVLPLREHLLPTLALDLGCGRGEWLALLTENGFDVHGVDLNNAMLSACRERGLTVHTGDALAFLRGLPDASQSIVSGFHIAEHMHFDALQELISESLRVLRPAGLLILETPNPENLVVGTSAFYLDHTHRRPIPPQALSFLIEFVGFKRSKVLRLQESRELADRPITLLDVLNGVSPDYAVVAQKDGPEYLFDALHGAFDAEYGLTLEMLANRYQQQVEAFIESYAILANRAKSDSIRAENRISQAEARASQAELRAIQAEARAIQVEVFFQGLINSNSWKITSPLRAVRRLFVRLLRR